VTSTCNRIPRGYRLLRRGETVRHGDLISYQGSPGWSPAEMSIGKRVWNQHGLFTRKVCSSDLLGFTLVACRRKEK